MPLNYNACLPLLVFSYSRCMGRCFLRVHLILSLRDNLCPDLAIFRIVSWKHVSAVVRIWPKLMWKKNGWGKRMKNVGLSFRRHFFSVDFSHVQTVVETEVHGKHMPKNSSIWAKVGSWIQCRWTLRVMGSWRGIILTWYLSFGRWEGGTQVPPLMSRKLGPQGVS